MATTDQALAEFRAARNELYEASTQRDRLALSRTRVLAEIAETNNRIDAARTRVNTARMAVIAAIQAEGPASAPAQPALIDATNHGATIDAGEVQ